MAGRSSHDWPQLLAGVPFDWVLIPLNGNKCPIDPATGHRMDEWQKQSGYTPEELASMNGLVRAVGVLLGPASGGLLAVDFDGPGADEKFLESTGHSSDDLPLTIAVTSGRDKRQQRFFTVNSDWIEHLRSRQFKNSNGKTILEFRWQGAQSVIAGDHPETTGYRWIDGFSPAQIEPALAPDWLLEAVVSGGPQAPALPPPVRSNGDDTERAKAMLKCLPPAQFQSYDAWLEVGMALHGTDPCLLNDWVEWSRSMGNFNEAECLSKWQSFGRYPGRGRTIASLHHLAKQHGYRESNGVQSKSQPSSLAPRSDRDNFDESDRVAWRELEQIARDLLREGCPPHERNARLRHQANNRGFAVRDGELFQLFAAARRKIQGRAGAVTPDDEFDIPEEVWAWNQIIAANTPNLVVALQKVGKTALMAGLISAWHYGAGSFLGLEFNGPCPPVLIAGTDQTLADWRAVLAPAGLMDKNPASGNWRLTPGGPIKRLWHRSQPVYLDIQGTEDIAKECERHPGALLICDTYAALTAPLGLDEAKPEAAEPLYNLMELVEPYGTTPVLLHHASKSRANERASNASRNSNAIPAAVSQIVSLQWLEPDRKSDQRINLTTEGRNSRPVDLVIEQIERSQWISHGTAQDIKEARRLEKVEAGLSDRQAVALDAIRDAWNHHREMTAPELAELLPDEFNDARKARATLQQLFDKGLADKRNDLDPSAGGTVIRYRPTTPPHARGASKTPSAASAASASSLSEPAI